ncbi:MAG TPA: sulfotransferase [Gammaproteobacteria bacterium]|nr:sulfotransferase [Gammaproteobacteria bacterium]
MDLEDRYQEALNLFKRGEIAVAEQHCLALLKKDRQAGVLHLLGLCQFRQNRVQEAIGSYTEALNMGAEDATLLNNLGRAYSMRGEWMAAAQAYVRAIALDPEQKESYLYLGPIYEQVGDMQSAERAYRRVLELDPQLAAASASLASFYEKANRMEEAEQLTRVALQQDGNDTVANLTRAQLDYRRGAYMESAERLDGLLRNPLTLWNRAIAAGRLGAAYDKLERYDEAFAAFVAGKQSLLDGDLVTAGTNLYSLETLALMRRHLEGLLSLTQSTAAESRAAPVFLVGFPRSGTTLLDQILSSHPNIVVLEEKGILQHALQEFLRDDESLQRLASLDTAALEKYQQRYWQLADKVLGNPIGGRLLVDKLPLYTSFMPAIQRIFPTARFIFALRDPRDVVLSCFMHAFSLNEAMRHFLTLEGTAGYYAAVMDVGIASLERMPGRVLRLNYEALIDDTETEARRLCEFLGVEWRDQILRFYDTAKKRQINTPSYHQVVQPVYRTAQGRWRHYAGHLSPVLGRLQPYVAYFGYKPDSGA